MVRTVSVSEIRLLSEYEMKTIIEGLELLQLHGGKDSKWTAGVMLEDDAAFIKTLFWSK